MADSVKLSFISQSISRSDKSNLKCLGNDATSIARFNALESLKAILTKILNNSPKTSSSGCAVALYCFLSFEKVNDLDLKNFLNAAEFFVYPSKAEGFGIPPLEAGALCTPVVCSNTTAMADFDFFNPYFFDPNNYEEFAKIINQMTQNIKSIDLSAIQSTIKGKYSWEESARIMLEKVISV